MGEVAKTLVSLSGPEAVHGIIPTALMGYERGWDPSDPGSVEKAIDPALFGRTTLVNDMHTRKRMMAREVTGGGPGGGFVAISGGWGTLEELMEITTWNQLGLHDRGVALYNVEGYWDPLLAWAKNAVAQGFIKPSNASIVVEATTADGVVKCLRDYQKSEERFNLPWASEG